ncbi:unnamed protein product, partial [Polarella glacialis]
ALKRCCTCLTAVLSEVCSEGGPGSGDGADRALLPLLVRALLALAKMKVLHQAVLDGLARAAPERLVSLDAARRVEALSALASLGVHRHAAGEHWAESLGAAALRQLGVPQLANLSWAAASLELESSKLPDALAGHVATLEFRGCSFCHLSKLAWGLAKMLPERPVQQQQQQEQ